MIATSQSKPLPRVRAVRGVKANEAIPAYGVGDGVLCFRHGLESRERKAIDRALELVGRSLRQPTFTAVDPAAVSAYLQMQLGGESTERFGVLFLDAQNRAIAFEVLFSGTLHHVSVYPREVVRAAMRHNACDVVLCHNHPSGMVEPSKADEILTQTLKTALSFVDVQVLDHIIVGHSSSLSMAERGLL